MKNFKVKAVERNEWFIEVKADNKDHARKIAHEIWSNDSFSFEKFTNGKTNTIFGEVEDDG